MTKTNEAKDVWECPVVLRMAAADAEMMNGPFADRNVPQMRGS
jgi:hypothetical protein